MSTPRQRVTVPRESDDDFTRAAADARAPFATERTGVELSHVGAYSFDPATVQGNIEHFVGAAQVPIGLAGPLLVDGEHAQGEFYVPMATSEGTLVASYNRGMRLLHEAGGVKTTHRRRPHAARSLLHVPQRPGGAGLRPLADRAL